MKKFQFGFSLVEIMVVVSIIGALSAVAYANFSQSSAQSRDVQRQADLRIVSTALDMYKSEYGRYPEGCNGPNKWSGHSPDYSCSSGNQYIEGLAPEFIPRLPQDPKLNGDNSGYVYTTNTDGTVYKFTAYKTVESEEVTYSHEFKFCDTDYAADSAQICVNVSEEPYYNDTPDHCKGDDAIFKTSYATWGGFTIPSVAATHSNFDASVDRYTEEIICDKPVPPVPPSPVPPSDDEGPGWTFNWWPFGCMGC